MTLNSERPTILIVDQTPSDLHSMIALFEEQGYQVSSAQNGEQALQQAKQLKPDLILLDHMLPDVDGFEVCQCLKADDAVQNIPVIFMVSEGKTEYIERCFQAGGADYVSKPLQIDALMARVATHLKLHQLEQQNARLQQRISASADKNQQWQTSERLYRTLLENHPDGIVRLDLQGRHLYVNQAALDTSGMSAVSLLGKTICELPVPGNPELMQPLSNATHKVAATATMDIMEFTWPNGNVSEIRHIPELNEQGEVTSILAIAREITEQKRMELMLTKREREFRTLAENSTDYIMRYDHDCRILYLNPQLERLFGMSAAELIGKKPGEAWPDGRFDELQVKIEQAIKSDEGNDYITEEGNGEGKNHYHLRLMPERDEDGNVCGLINIARDITELKQAENLLKEKERVLRSLVENSPDIIVRYDTDCRRIFVNPAYIQQTGTPLENALNASTDEARIWRPNLSREEYRQRLQQVMASGVPDKILLEWVHDDGQNVSHEMYVVAEYDSEGRVIGTLALGRDLSDHKRMQEEILYREKMFRTLAENSPNIIIRYDRDCRRLYVNPAYTKLTGISPSEAINNLPDATWAAMPEMPVDKYKAILGKAMDTGESTEFFMRWSSLSGNDCTSHAVQVVPEYNLDGQVVGTLVIGHDITEIKNFEEQLAQSYEQLRGLTAQLVTVREEERKRIARDMHDELGQYLTSLRMGIGILLMKLGEDNPTVLKPATEMRSLVDKIIQVVRDVATSMRPAPLNLGVISALEWLSEEFTARTGVACNLNTDEEEITLDDNYATAIFRMVQESLTNVTRHAQASQVEINFHCRGSEYILDVNDNGKGFEAPVTNPKSFGLIGLRERASMLNGEVDITSEPNCGTTVTVTIPVPAIMDLSEVE